MKNDNDGLNFLDGIVYHTENDNDVSLFLEQDIFPFPFNELVASFVCSFSLALMSYPGVKAFPDLVALAFWMRKSNIKKIEEDFNKYDICRVPVGNVIHFAPSNVDTIFIYSLFLSLLVGNNNIVRVSEKRSLQKDILIDIINKELNKDQFAELKSRLAIITYPHSDQLSSYLCSKVDMRVIWGGDETVSKITSFPLSPNATEIKFVGKYSISLIKADMLDKLSDDEYESLINNFVNDTYWFGQQGCSSPRTVVWISGNTHQNQIELFWRSVALKAENTFADDVIAADVMNKIVATNLMAVKSSGSHISTNGKMVTRISVPCIEQHNILRNFHCGSGLFIEISIDSLSELKMITDRKLQTISYAGFAFEEIKENLINSGVYPDRVVPVGGALDFSIKWDGFDLLHSLTRIVDFK